MRIVREFNHSFHREIYINPVYTWNFFVSILHWRLNGHLLCKCVKTRYLFLDQVRRGVGLFPVCGHMLFFMYVLQT